MRNTWIPALLVLALPRVAGAWGYCGAFSSDVVWDICLPETAGVCASSWSTAFEADTAHLNNVLGQSPWFLKLTTPDASFGPGDGRNDVVFTNHATASASYGPVSASVIAQTVTFFPSGACGPRSEVDMMFFVDHAFTQTRENATTTRFYFGEVASHEIGHAATLQHEDTVLTLMNTYAHTPAMLDYPHRDEILGLLAHPDLAGATYTDIAVLPYDASPAAVYLTTPPVLSSPATVIPGQQVVVDDYRVENWGPNGGPVPVEVTYVLSTNDVGSTNDQILGSTTWTSVTNRGVLSSPASLTIPETPAGTYYVIGVNDIDQTLAEAYTSNDQVVFGTVQVGASPPDLALHALVPDRYGGLPGEPFDVTYTRSNEGGTASGAYRLSIRLSTNLVITTQDPEACSVQVASQAAYTDLGRVLTCTFPNITPGPYYVGAIIDVDDQVAESDETNNTLAYPMDVWVDAGPPDLVVGSLSATPSEAAPGQNVSFSYIRENLGYTDAGAYDLSIRLSANATITTTDPEVCRVTVSAGQPARTSLQRSAQCTLPDLPAGSYHLGAIIDVDDAVVEVDEANTTLAPDPFDVRLQLQSAVLRAGQAGWLRVTNAAPGESVTFVRGSGVGNGVCPPQLGGACADILGPTTVLGSAVADATGRATLTGLVPPAAAGAVLFVQAGALRGAGGTDSVLSQVLTTTVLP